MTRPEIVGPDTPTAPYPIVVGSLISAGFGRGSSELGIPTANIDPELLSQLETGVYYGWALLSKGQAKASEPAGNSKEEEASRKVDFNYGSKLEPAELEQLPMVMSIGWNPFYNNTKKSAEVHICHKFKHNFYGAHIRVAVMGFIRPEQDYDGVEALIADINTDIQVALRSLKRPGYQLKLEASP